MVSGYISTPRLKSCFHGLKQFTYRSTRYRTGSMRANPDNIHVYSISEWFNNKIVQLTTDMVLYKVRMPPNKAFCIRNVYILVYRWICIAQRIYG